MSKTTDNLFVVLIESIIVNKYVEFLTAAVDKTHLLVIE